MKKILVSLLLLTGLTSYSQTYVLTNHDLIIRVVKNGSITFDIGKWLSNFLIVGDSVKWTYQKNEDNAHFILYLDKDSVTSPVMASSTALYDTLVAWTIGSSGGGGLVIDTGNFWNILGNAGTVSGTNFVGTTDNQDLDFRANNTFWMRLRATGQLEFYTGLDSVGYALYTDVPRWDSKNTAAGDSSMYNNNPLSIARLRNHTNTAYGVNTLKNAVGSYANTAIGAYALETLIGRIVFGGTNFPPTSGFENVAVGAYALRLDTSGIENTAVGTGAMENCLGCIRNTGIGQFALGSITTGSVSVGVGRNAGALMTTGLQNVFIGNDAGFNTTTGQDNIGIGFEVLKQVGGSTSANYAIGKNALQFAGSTGSGGGFNIAIGRVAGSANTTGLGNIYIGHGAGKFITDLENIMIIDNFEYSGSDRGSVTGDTTRAIVFAEIGRGDPCNQRFKVNGRFGINDTCTIRGLGQRLYLASIDGYLMYTIPQINTTSGDAATIDAVSGRFRKDSSGSTFTLTNSFITANSIIMLTPANAALDVTAVTWTVSAGAGTATITFGLAPSADFNMNFLIEN